VCVSSRRGQCRGVARLDPDAAPGMLFMPMHWNELWSLAASPNESTTGDSDPISKQPALKFCAVSVRLSPSPAGRGMG